MLIPIVPVLMPVLGKLSRIVLGFEFLRHVFDAAEGCLGARHTVRNRRVRG